MVTSSSGPDLAKGVGASTVFDANDKVGALPSAIRRLHGDGVVAGPVVTAGCAEASVTAVLAALETAAAGSVLVVQGAGDWAYVGELLSSEAVRAGVVAIVIDGFARDLAPVQELPISLFARGLTPRGARFGDVGQVGIELVVGETRVRPGDWAIGDADGVTVVAADDAERVIAKAEHIARSESELAAQVLGGTSLLEHRNDDGKTLRELLH